MTGIGTVTNGNMTLTVNADGTYSYKVIDNGTYTFTVTDKAGNSITYDVTISNIDKLALVVTASSTSQSNGSATNTSYTNNPLIVSFDFYDIASTSTDGCSEVASFQYIISDSSTAPSESSSAWVSYTGDITLSASGVYYIYCKVADYAGNITITQVGKFTILTLASDDDITVDSDEENNSGTATTATEEYVSSGGDSNDEAVKAEDVFEIHEHIAYINGYEDGTVRPNANITREETTSIFYILLNDGNAAVICPQTIALMTFSKSGGRIQRYRLC